MQSQQHIPGFCRRHPWVTAVALLGAVWLALSGSYTLLAVTSAAAAVIGFRRYRRSRAIHRAGLGARADLEHRMALAGDPRGIYGRFPPVRPGWFPDPAHTAQIRYFDGVAWTGLTAAR